VGIVAEFGGAWFGMNLILGWATVEQARFDLRVTSWSKAEGRICIRKQCCHSGGHFEAHRGQVSTHRTDDDAGGLCTPASVAAGHCS